jgi:hypothetical protein
VWPADIQGVATVKVPDFFQDLLQEAIEHAQALSIHNSGSGEKDPRVVVPALHAFENDTLHISLSRNTYFKIFQLDSFVHELRLIFQAQQPFYTNFTDLEQFANDERTRSFLALRVGGGLKQVIKPL